MSRFSTPDVEDSIGCNLIPMIDIMFLLLLFFMLSADMSTREMEDLVLPPADQVQEDKNVKGVDGYTTVNIHHTSTQQGVMCPLYKANSTCKEDNHWLISIRGREYNPDTIAAALSSEAQLELSEEIADPATGKKLSNRRVMIRADGLASYGYIQKVLEGCAFAGIYKVEIAAAKPTP